MATIGVKIELEGAPQYKENMQNLTAQTKLYQAQMKRLQSEMKEGVSAFTRSINTSKALQQQLEAQTNQSKLLEEQIAKTSEKYGEDSTQVIRLKTQYENLQRAIAETNRALDENGGLAGAVGAQFQETGRKVSETGEKISGIGEKMSVVSGTIVAAGAASVKAWTEVDSGLDTIIKKTGATGEALEELEQISNNIATSIPASFDEVGNAVGEVNTRFGSTGQALEDLSKQFIEFAQLNDTDVSSSIDNVQAAMAAFGIDTKDAGMVLDVLNKAGQNTGISMDALSNSLLANASALTEMGLDFNQSAGFISSLEKNGIDASAAMAGLKKAFSNAVNDGKSMDQALAELQATMASSETNTEAYSAAIELFGAKAGPAIAKAVQEGRLAFDEASNSISDYANSVSNTFDATLDPLDSFQTNMNQIKLLGADIVTTAGPMITEVMTKMSEAVKKAADAWNGMSEEQQQNIIKIAGIVAAIGPVLLAIGKTITSIGNLSAGVGKIITNGPIIASAISSVDAAITGTVIPAITGAITAMLPVLPIILGIAAAIAAVILVVKNWGTITDWISEKWALFTEALSLKVEEIKLFFTNGINMIKEFLYSKIMKIIAKVNYAWTSIKEAFTAGKEKIIQNVKNIFSTITSTFGDLKNKALTWGSDMIQGFIDGIKAKWEALKQSVIDVGNTIKSYLGFSVPEKGPLHESMSWPKHFMENYSKGLESARYLIQTAVGDISQDIAVLENPINAAEIYDAVRSGASNANLSLSIGEREFGRALREMGVSFGG